jgi:hypothetical protein
VLEGTLFLNAGHLREPTSSPSTGTTRSKRSAARGFTALYGQGSKGKEIGQPCPRTRGLTIWYRPDTIVSDHRLLTLALNCADDSFADGIGHRRTWWRWVRAFQIRRPSIATSQPPIHAIAAENRTLSVPYPSLADSITNSHLRPPVRDSIFCERSGSLKAAPHRRLDDDQFPKPFVGRYHA